MLRYNENTTNYSVFNDFFSLVCCLLFTLSFRFIFFSFWFCLKLKVTKVMQGQRKIIIFLCFCSHFFLLVKQYNEQIQMQVYCCLFCFVEFYCVCLFVIFGLTLIYGLAEQPAEPKNIFRKGKIKHIGLFHD